MARGAGAGLGSLTYSEGPGPRGAGRPVHSQVAQLSRTGPVDPTGALGGMPCPRCMAGLRVLSSVGLLYEGSVDSGTWRLLPQVDPMPFYEACVHDSCSCDTGGDCECFCSAVASYAQECTKEGACVFWRTPDLCRECLSVLGGWDLAAHQEIGAA